MPPAPGQRRAQIAAAALATAVLAAYVPALRAGFVYDDHLLFDAGMLARPLSWFWTSTAQFDWWPLSWTALWLQGRVWGDAPAGWHAVSVAVHAVAAILLWRVLAALRIPGAWLGGLLFALHPAAVESVAWISELKNPLSAALAFGAALAWLRWDERRDARPPIAALALFALALMAKASVVMLPVVLLAIAAVRRGRLDGRELARLLPFFALSAGLGAVTLWFQTRNAIGGLGITSRPALDRVGDAGWALLWYVERAFLPVRLGFVADPWPRPGSPLFLAPLAALAIAGAALWRLRRLPAVRPVALALGYHAVVVLPVLGLVEIAYFHVGPASNHLQYLALAGPAALAGAAIAGADARWRFATRASTVAVVAALALYTARRAAEFHDDRTLWAAAARDAPHNLYATFMYADQLGGAGLRSEALGVLAAYAERSHDEALRHRALASWMLHARRYPEALAEALEAERLQPDPEFRVEIGQMLVRSGQPQLAIALLDPLVRSAPGNGAARLWLDRAREELRRP